MRSGTCKSFQSNDCTSGWVLEEKKALFFIWLTYMFDDWLRWYLECRQSEQKMGSNWAQKQNKFVKSLGEDKMICSTWLNQALACILCQKSHLWISLQSFFSLFNKFLRFNNYFGQQNVIAGSSLRFYTRSKKFQYLRPL